MRQRHLYRRSRVPHVVLTLAALSAQPRRRSSCPRSRPRTRNRVCWPRGNTSGEGTRQVIGRVQSHWCEPACRGGVLAWRVELWSTCGPIANLPPQHSPASVSLNFSTSTCASALSYARRPNAYSCPESRIYNGTLARQGGHSSSVASRSPIGVQEGVVYWASVPVLRRCSGCARRVRRPGLPGDHMRAKGGGGVYGGSIRRAQRRAGVLGVLILGAINPPGAHHKCASGAVGVPALGAESRQCTRRPRSSRQALCSGPRGGGSRSRRASARRRCMLQ